eukprot:CAMPEP_0116844494 /NCGR_PEP_ID=MMETSP0418-20121206/12724_1 /TAXON_ID=1158023 /ORGANISM="Astrosyne radiata, Strain 13vi08-1A" /LENGTH=211 /DNA_ID=CAMNT_0004475463 /DNA_START=18 /DNA_END=653 /DNA_ORIENTATION=+
MDILEVDEERAKALIEEHGSSAAAIAAGSPDDDEAAPSLAAATGAESAPGAMTSAERKARKAFDSLGLVEQPGFKRVMINYARHGALAIDQPSVHRLPGTDYWVVFGVALPADFSRSSDAARQFSLQQAAAAEAPEAAEVAADAAAASSTAASTAAAEEDVDLSDLPEGIVAKDVDFVANHAGVTRAQAVEALKKHGSVVPAAMSFSDASA